jgi:hypothetical protein
MMGMRLGSLKDLDSVGFNPRSRDLGVASSSVKTAASLSESRERFRPFVHFRVALHIVILTLK